MRGAPGRWRTPRGYAPERLPWGRDHAEWAPTVTTPGPRRDGLVRALTAVREAARAQADDVLGHVPDTGDRTTGRAVDDFVEQAADALRALDESVAETLRALVPERR
jgi:transposase